MTDLAQRLGRELTERRLWREGMSAYAFGGFNRLEFSSPNAWIDGWKIEDVGDADGKGDAYPDLDDWPTVGALLGLAIEVCGGPVRLMPFHNGTWAAWAQDANTGQGPTPGTALAALLLSVWEAPDG